MMGVLNFVVKLLSNFIFNVGLVNTKLFVFSKCNSHEKLGEIISDELF